MLELLLHPRILPTILFAVVRSRVLLMHLDCVDIDRGLWLLLPGEFFTITGLYGSSYIRLYLQEIIVGIVILIIIILLFVFISIPRIRRIFNKKYQSKAIRQKPRIEFSMTRAVLIGFFSGLLFLIAYYAVQVLFGVQGSYYYYNSPLPILFAILSFVAYGLALFGLPYYLYSRFNKREGAIAGIISSIAAIIYFVIIFYLFPHPTVCYTCVQPLAGAVA